MVCRERLVESLHCDVSSLDFCRQYIDKQVAANYLLNTLNTGRVIPFSKVGLIGLLFVSWSAFLEGYHWAEIFGAEEFLPKKCIACQNSEGSLKSRNRKICLDCLLKYPEAGEA